METTWRLLKPATGPLRRRQLLHVLLAEYFSIDELRLLAAEVGIDPDEVGGASKTEWALNLALYANRHGLFRQLVAAAQAHRPHVSFE